MTPPKVLRERLELLERHGFKAVSCEVSGSTHWKVRFEGLEHYFVFPTSASDWRAIRNALAQLRRAQREEAAT